MDDCKSYFLETGRRVSFEYTLLGTLAVPSHCIYMFFDKMSLNCFIVYLFYTFFHTNMGEVKFVASWDQ